MPKCMVNGCKNGNKKTIEDHFILHVFPKEECISKKWLIAIGIKIEEVENLFQKILNNKRNDPFRICSDHFKTEDYSEGAKKKRLKKDAVPSLNLNLTSIDVSLTNTNTRRKITDGCRKCGNTDTFDQHEGEDFFGAVTGRNYSQRCSKKKSIGFKRKAEDSLGEHEGSSTINCQRSTIDVLSTEIQPECILDETTLSVGIQNSNSTEFTVNECANIEKENVIIKCVETETEMEYMSPEEDNNAIDKDDQEYTPSNESDSLENETEEEEWDRKIPNGFHCLENYLEDNEIGKQKTFFVYESCLMQLISKIKCQQSKKCASPITHVKKNVIGSYVSFDGVCSQGHIGNIWESQPRKKRIYFGNVVMSSAILLSGSSYEKVHNMFNVMGMYHVSSTTHYRNQKKNLFPVIDNTWKKEQEKTIEDFKDKSISVLGDGQCDSPGHSAKYCTYTTMEETSKKILDFNIQQIEAGIASVSLEKKACEESINWLKEKRYAIDSFCTDRHSGIKKLMRTTFPEIHHAYDVWHFAKSLRYKLSEVSKKRTCKEIRPWINSAVNHLWWSARTCDGNSEILKEKWTSIVHHIVNKHEWSDSNVYHRCSHHLLQLKDVNETKWLQESTEAYTQFKSIVTNKKFLEELEHLASFKHTGDLEVYHSNLLKYRSKRFHYDIDAMYARTQLAAIDHNFNVNRPRGVLKTTSNDGEEVEQYRYKMEFSKISNKWVIKNIFEPTSNEFQLNILSDIILFSKKQLNIHWESHASEVPDNIASLPKPCKDTLIAIQETRFKK